MNNACLRMNFGFIAETFKTRIRMSSAKSFPNGIENAKRGAAFAAVNIFVQDGQTIGVGSGSTIEYAVQRLAERVSDEKIKVTCVPTSYQARDLVLKYKLPLSDLNRHLYLDVAIDGADEVDEGFTLIKGGGGCLTQEKIVAAAAKKFVVIADHRKKSNILGDKWKKGVPIEVIPMAIPQIQSKIEEKYGGICKIRVAQNKAVCSFEDILEDFLRPLINFQGPVITDNGQMIIDWQFDKVHNWTNVHQFIKLIPGVVETGLFVNMTNTVIFGSEDGNYEMKTIKGVY